jgi:geranylgeranyl diphosphate synthase, type II
MEELKKRIMRVPAEPEIRESLTMAIREALLRQQLTPPVPFARILALAEEAVAQTGVDPGFMEFAMVLTGNEIWRPLVAATPFHRRLLLLPQCLKNNQNCQGVFDELGLVCHGCNSCSLDYIVSKAERLGYATLIAEGTTVAIGLVEEGSVDAVIGVSCMSTLERSFEKVKRSALPVIGIPLLCEGCTDTSVDEKWLLHEVNLNLSDKAYQPLSVSLLKHKVAGFFEEDYLLRLLGDKGNPTLEMAIRSMRHGGQRMRPLLTALAFSAFSQAENEDLMGQLAVIIECFHKASLIHDDIEDRDDYRYNRETLHKQEGIPLAINAGDYLIGKGYELLGKLPLSCEKRAECLSLVASAHVALTLGQGADLLADRDKHLPGTEELLNIYALKTGAAVEVALLLGAIAAGAGKTDLGALREFARFFGIAYQVRDDLEEFQLSTAPLTWHEFPFLVALLKEQLNGNAPVDTLTNLDFEEIRALISNQNIGPKTAGIVTDYVEKAYASLDKLSNLPLKLSLYGVLGKIFRDYEPA